MPFAFIVPWLAYLVIFGIVQFRFHNAHIKRYGGPSLRERNRMYFTRPLEFLGLIRKPPFALSAMWRRVDDPVVERLRRQYLLVATAGIVFALLFFVGAIVYGILFVW